MHFLRRFPNDAYAAGFESWAWQPDLAGMTPLFASAFGDVFLTDDGGAWHLDIVAGSLTRRWATEAALWAELDTARGQESLLEVTFVIDAHQAGHRPSDSEILTYRLPPVLGGTRDLDNVEVAGFPQALALAGDIHRQVREPDRSAPAHLEISDDEQSA